MVKNDIINHVALEHEITFLDAEKAVNSIFNSMTEALIMGERIELRGLGVFTVREYKSYIGRNPKDGSLVHVKEKKLPYFKVGKWLMLRLNRNLLDHHPNFLNQKTVNETGLSRLQIQWKIDHPNSKTPIPKDNEL